MSYGSSAEAKKAGWFSRRHQTRDEHEAAKVHGPVPKENKRIEAEQRLADRAARSDAEQLEILESKGHADCKEAKRLRTKLYADVTRSGGDPFKES